MVDDGAQSQKQSTEGDFSRLGHETNFPKHTADFDEISRYLEEHADFSFNLSDFDAIWEDYQAH